MSIGVKGVPRRSLCSVRTLRRLMLPVLSKVVIFYVPFYCWHPVLYD